MPSSGASAMLRIAALIILAATLSAQQTIDAVHVISRPVQRKLELPGEFLPYEKTSIHANAAGFIQKVLVDRGSRVQEGDLLAEIVAPELESHLAEARARVFTAESQVAEAQAQVAAARSTYEKMRAASQTP